MCIRDSAKVSTQRDRFQVLEGGSVQLGHEYRRLAAPNKIREAQAATALLVYGRLKPTWLKLRPWYEDRALTRQVKTPPADKTPPPAAAHAAQLLSTKPVDVEVTNETSCVNPRRG